MAEEIAWQWRYLPPYNFYDADADAEPEDLAELREPSRWPEVFETCLQGSDFVGFFTASFVGDSAEVGLGPTPT